MFATKRTAEEAETRNFTKEFFFYQEMQNTLILFKKEKKNLFCAILLNKINTKLNSPNDWNYSQLHGIQ